MDSSRQPGAEKEISATSIAKPKTLADLKEVKLGTKTSCAEIKSIIAAIKEKYASAWWISDWGDNSFYYVEDLACKAITLGDLEIMRLLLDEGLPPEVTGGIKYSDKGLLYFAVKSNRDMFSLLLKAIEKITLADRWTQKEAYQFGMQAAVESGNIEIVKLLFTKGVDPNGYTSEKQLGAFYFNYLADAAFHNRQDLALCLVQHGADVQKALENFHEGVISAGDRYSPQFSSKKTQIRYQSVIKFLFDYAAGVNWKKDLYRGDFWEQLEEGVSGFNFVGVSIDGKPIDKLTLVSKKLKGTDKALVTLSELETLSAAESSPAEKKRYQHIQTCLSDAFKKQGRYIEEKTEQVNLVPLLAAAKIGDAKSVAFRVKVSSPDDINEALVIASEKGHIEVVKILINNSPTYQRILPLAIHKAQYRTHTSVASYLLSFLQNINQPDFTERTLLHYAIKNGAVDEVKCVIEKKADINHKGTGEYLSPLYLAVGEYFYIKKNRDFSEWQLRRHLIIIKMLLEKKADVNIIMAKRETLLHTAVQGNGAEVVEILLATNRTDIEAVDKEGRSALHHAAMQDPPSPSIVKLLIDAGASSFPDKQDKEPQSYLALNITKTKHHESKLALTSYKEAEEIIAGEVCRQEEEKKAALEYAPTGVFSLLWRAAKHIASCDVDLIRIRCDFILSQSPLNKKEFADFEIKSNTAYVRSGVNLFYINKATKQFSKIPFSRLIQFDMGIAHRGSRVLTEKELERIASITGHHPFKKLDLPEALVEIVEKAKPFVRVRDRWSPCSGTKKLESQTEDEKNHILNPHTVPEESKALKVLGEKVSKYYTRLFTPASQVLGEKIRDKYHARLFIPASKTTTASKALLLGKKISKYSTRLFTPPQKTTTASEVLGEKIRKKYYTRLFIPAPKTTMASQALEKRTRKDNRAQ